MECVSRSILASKREGGDREERRKERRWTDETISTERINGIHSDRLSDKEQRQKIKGQVEVRQELRKPVLDEEKKIDFHLQWKPQQEVREKEEEE